MSIIIPVILGPFISQAKIGPSFRIYYTTECISYFSCLFAIHTVSIDCQNNNNHTGCFSLSYHSYISPQYNAVSMCDLFLKQTYIKNNIVQYENIYFFMWLCAFHCLWILCFLFSSVCYINPLGTSAKITDFIFPLFSTGHNLLVVITVSSRVTGTLCSATACVFINLFFYCCYIKVGRKGSS